MDTKQQERQVVRRRRHGSQLKARVLAECAEPGASVAKVALSYGLNANLVHKWRRQAQACTLATPAAALPAFIALEVPAAQAVSQAPQFIDLQLQRAGVKVRVRWPMMAASMSAAWLREILR